MQNFDIIFLHSKKINMTVVTMCMMLLESIQNQSFHMAFIWYRSLCGISLSESKDLLI